VRPQSNAPSSTNLIPASPETTQTPTVSAMATLSKTETHSHSTMEAEAKTKLRKGEDIFLALLQESDSSPVPPSHQKLHFRSNLVGFDPLLTPSSVSTTSSSSTAAVDEILANFPPILPILEQPREGRDNSAAPTRHMPSAPTTPTHNRSSKSRFGRRGHRKTQSLTGAALRNPIVRKNSISPKRRERSDQHTNEAPVKPGTPPPPQPSAPERSPSQSTPRILTWPKKRTGYHRKTRSVMAVPTVAPVTPVKTMGSVSASNSPTSDETHVTMSNTLNELLTLDVVTALENQENPLFLPSLAKPRPTSFLVGGQEGMVRSSEQAPSAFQLEIAGHQDTLTSAKLCQFLETCESEECLLDLQNLQAYTAMELAGFARGDVTLPNLDDCHRPLVEQLLDCGNDITDVKGFFTTRSRDDSELGREVLIVERQNKFVCVFRGTIPEQEGKFSKQSETIELPDGPKTSVYQDRYSAFGELQAATFELLDKVTEENPFCDILFTGHSFGGAIAALAAYTYANTRTSLRVACIVTACPKLGQDDFRWAVHSSPNLNMCRLEFHRAMKASVHVGHCIRLLLSGKDGLSVQAYKFGLDDHPDGLLDLLTTKKQKEKSVHEYVSFLENVPKWVKDFHNEDGAGVRGNDNETREMA
jgi:Lipase (class 3)